MKNNFIPSFPFHKKEVDNPNKSPPAFLARHPTTANESTEKKISILFDYDPLKEDQAEGKQVQTTE